MPINRFENIDCMIGMKEYPDKYFDLAIVDPPYGIGVDGAIHIRKPDRPSTWDMIEKYERKEWDRDIPSKEYWDELFRVSKNQIVWGGNYFTEYLPPKKCWVFWDKMFDKTHNFSHGELAWTSWETRMLKVVLSSKSESNGGKDRIHPTQKPPKLYKFLLEEFAKPNDKILDTHVGSASSLIACEDMGFEYVGFEIDKDYYEAAQKRLEQFRSQLKLSF